MGVVMGQVILVNNPYNPIQDLEVIEVDQPVTLRHWLDDRGIVEFSYPTTCRVDGVYVLRRDWPVVEIGSNSVVEFCAHPHGGGGGGGGGKQIMQVVAMIAIMVVAIYLGPVIGGVLAQGLGVAASATTTAIGSSIVMAVGGMAMGAMFSAPKPAMPSASWSSPGALPAASPTYALTATGNQGRLGQVIAEAFGRHKIVFDLGANAYQEYVDNDQYLFQLHVIGVGEYEIESLRIDDTPLASFEEVDFEVVQPGGAMTLISHVVTTAEEVAGQEARGPNQLSGGDQGWIGPFIINPAPTRMIALGIDVMFQRGLYHATDSGTLAEKSVSWRVEIRAVDDDGAAMNSDFVTSLAGDLSPSMGSLTFNETAIDGDTVAINGIVFTFVPGSPGDGQVQIGADAAGCATNLAAALNASSDPAVNVATYTVSGSTVLIAHDTAGIAGDAFTLAATRAEPSGETLTGGGFGCLAEETYAAATNTAIRRSYKYEVAAGRYQVRIKRTTANDQDSRTGHELRWGQARAYLNTVPNYGDVTLVAVKMRATDNLSSRSSRLINGICTRKLPMWNAATGWSAPVPTRSIAAAASYILRSENGARQPDKRFDVTKLWELHATWESRGDHFDGIFDSTLTAWEALSRVLKVGRGAPFQQGGVVRFMRDEPISLPSGLFNRRNIVKGSLNIQYDMVTEDTADAVTVQFFNRKTWAVDEVTAALRDGVVRVLSDAEMVSDPPINPARLEYMGITDEAHAGREACFAQACNLYRRRRPSWRTELDGRVLSFGEVVAISHPLPSWGQDGEIVAWDTGTSVLTLSEAVRWPESGALYLAMRARNGALAGDVVEIAPASDGDPFKVVALDPLPLVPDTGGDRERTYYAIGPADAWARRVRVRSIKPRKGQCEIVAVVEDDRVHVN